jgi:cell division septation protein DedD
MRALMIGAATAVVAGAMLTASPAMADVKAGVDAWSRGEYRQAVEQWRGPAVAGDPDAQFNLGQAYKLGRGVPEDPALAESWFRKAALQGHLQAEDNYALALFQGGKRAEAVPWLEKSVARGEARTQLVLGTMLFNGDGVKRDYPRAYALMSRASAGNLRSASETLAQMDQHISAADRERGMALAREYQARDRTAALSAPSTRQIVATPTDATRTVAQPPRRGPVGAMPIPPSYATESPTPAPTRAATRAASPTRIPRQVIAPPVKPLAARPIATPPPMRAPEPAPAMRGGYRIQLGAFRDPGNARALWARLGGRVGGQPSYAATGGVTRLQAGPYRTHAEAARACAASRVSCVVIAS